MKDDIFKDVLLFHYGFHRKTYCGIFQWKRPNSWDAAAILVSHDTSNKCTVIAFKAAAGTNNNANTC